MASQICSQGARPCAGRTVSLWGTGPFKAPLTGRSSPLRVLWAIRPLSESAGAERLAQEVPAHHATTRGLPARLPCPSA